ncbi:MAG TPA: aspartate-semialdehyde dehydrogenase [Candidatus Aphodomonas merdavium]|nr:aspartate-semialdehyde dehydrogenase [Candidatus Aphodomonas merdavium]
MKKYNVAILGATGCVGREMLKVLAEHAFPVGELRLLASARSAGKKVTYCGKEYTVEEAGAASFAGMDLVLGAASNALAKQLAPEIVRAGAVFVDNSSAFRMENDVPLVVPEINPDDVARHSGIIANPNCSTIIALMAVAPIARISPIEAMTACTYQAVSGAGQGGMEQLEAEISALSEGKQAPLATFPCQIAYNCIPHIGSRLENGFTTEEMKMQNEGRKILHLPQLRVNCTCVRVPVMRSHSIAITLRTKESVSVEAAAQAIASAPGCVLASELNGRDYPTPLDTTDQDLVFVGRLRRDLIDEERGLSLWCCGDQIRKGAATNAVQIAEIALGIH